MGDAGSAPAKDFFVSYTGADRAWAEWVGWTLEDAGHSVILQAWDFKAGENFIRNMHRALQQCGRTIAVFSDAYMRSGFCEDEWTSAFITRNLIPIRIDDVQPTGLLKPLGYLDIFGLEEDEARAQLLAALKAGRGKPDVKAHFPGSVTRTVAKPSRFPAKAPAVWSVPHRNPHFSGREGVLERLEAALAAGGRSALTQVLAGLGGIGKTELALEYAHRFQDRYDLVWWCPSEAATQLAASYRALAGALDLRERDAARDEDVVRALRTALEARSGWLLVFDNADSEGDLIPFVPSRGGGHVIVTSRDNAWRRLATPLEVGIWPRAEAVEFLLARSGDADTGAAGRLAEALGDLPLALEQATAYVRAGHLSLARYLEMLEQGYAADLWRRGADPERTVAVTWELSFAKVAELCPAAAQLLDSVAFLAPDAIPLALIRDGAPFLPEPLKAACGNPVVFEDAIAALVRYSLVGRDGDHLSVHRIVQAVTRNRLSDDDRRMWAGRAASLFYAVLVAPTPDRKSVV